MRPATAFTLDPGLSALEPPEARGLARDQVRLLVAHEHRPLRHLRFDALPRALRRGDLVVVNTSDTEPAAVDGRRGDGRPVVLHVSGPVPGGGPEVVVELRTPDGRRIADGAAGERIRLPGGTAAILVAGHPDAGVRDGSRLWRARIPVPDGVPRWLRAVGRPIRYSYLRRRWPLAAHRTLFATAEGEFGSAEMPSAARPFTPSVLAGLRAHGIGVAKLVLHTGVSSQEAHEAPQAEWFEVSETAAQLINAAHGRGQRIIAVGTLRSLRAL